MSEENIDLMPDPEHTPEQTFLESDSKYWNGEKLNAFSYRRQAAAEMLGMRFGFLTREEIAEQAERGMYPGMTNDAVIVVYLCVASDDEVRRVFDSRERKKFVERMETWQEEQQIGFGSEGQQKALRLMIEIIGEVQRAAFKPDVGQKSKGSAPKN